MTLMSHDNDGKCCVQRADYDRLRSLLRRCEGAIGSMNGKLKRSGKLESGGELLADIRAALDNSESSNT